jgi:hypothetical protein
VPEVTFAPIQLYAVVTLCVGALAVGWKLLRQGDIPESKYRWITYLATGILGVAAVIVFSFFLHHYSLPGTLNMPNVRLEGLVWVLCIYAMHFGLFTLLLLVYFSAAKAPLGPPADSSVPRTLHQAIDNARPTGPIRKATPEDYPKTHEQPSDTAKE